MLMQITTEDGVTLNVIVIGGRGFIYNGESGSTQTIPDDEVTGLWFDEHMSCRPATKEEADAYIADHGKGPEEAVDPE